MQLKATIIHCLYHKLHFFVHISDLRDTVYELLALHHNSFPIIRIKKWEH